MWYRGLVDVPEMSLILSEVWKFIFDTHEHHLPDLMFDFVNHKILLKKLALRNINKYLWLGLKSFLESRTLQVNLLGEERSFTALCPAGVPQGFVISGIHKEEHFTKDSRDVSS